MLIDTHAHLFWDSYKEDFDEVIVRSKEAGLGIIINVGVDVNLSKTAAELENDQIKFYSTIGIHPEEAIHYANDSGNKISENIQKLEDIYNNNPNKVIGIGECGLDYLIEDHPEWIPEGLTFEEIKSLQKKLLQAQIDLSNKLDLPLVIHCRDNRSKDPTNTEAWTDLLEMIKDSRGILHCYSGLENITQQALPLNFLFSFNGTLTYPKNDYLREAVKNLPLEKIVLETDCPFLPPQKLRGQRNEPKAVRVVAELISELRGINYSETEEQTTQNVKQLFDI